MRSGRLLERLEPSEPTADLVPTGGRLGNRILREAGVE